MSTHIARMSPVGFLVTEELLKELDVLFPNQCPPVDLPYNEIMFRSGQRSVVDTLWHHLREAQDNLME